MREERQRFLCCRSGPELTHGLLGCGAVGLELGSRLLANGQDLIVHDLDESRAAPLLRGGATWAGDASALVERVGVLISTLPRPRDAEAVFLSDSSPWNAAKPQTLHIETATLGPDCVRRLSSAARTCKVRYIDSPISRDGNREGSISMVAWVGGNVDYVDLARPILERMVDRVVYCGRTGDGQITKLVNNLVAHSLTVLSSEALLLGVKAGVSLDLLSNALQHGTGQNRVMDELLPESVFRGNWKPGLKLGWAIKDLELAQELADKSAVPLSGIDRIMAIYEAARARGWDELSAHTVVRLLEESSGTELRLTDGGDKPKS